MGEPSPEVLEIKCSSCDTGFRLRLKTGRLPRHDIECPACGASISVASLQDKLQPKAAVLRRTTEMGRLPGGGVDQSGDRLVAPDLPHQSKGTLLGLPVDDLFPGDVAPHGFENTPTSASGSPIGRTPLGFQEISESDIRNTTRHPWESAKTSAQLSTLHVHEKKTDPTLPSVDDSGSLAFPNLENSSSPRLETKSSPEARQTPTQGVESTPAPPKLNELLRKVREKRGTDPLLKTPASSAPASPVREESLPATTPAPPVREESLSTTTAHRDTTREIRIPKDGLASKSQPLAQLELAQAHIVKKKAVPPRPAIPQTPKPEMTPPGLASEKRGSGYIRLPTSEILEVIGTGEFRLKVDDIIYEPVDENGLVRLIKGGVLMGAELIAETDGDWMPVNQHPVMEKLRQRMANEVHSLLKDVTKSHAPPVTEELPEDFGEELESELGDSKSSPPPLPTLGIPNDAVSEAPTQGLIVTEEPDDFDHFSIPPLDAESSEAEILVASSNLPEPSFAKPDSSVEEHVDVQEPPLAKGPQKADPKLARAVGVTIVLGLLVAIALHQWSAYQDSQTARVNEVPAIPTVVTEAPEPAPPEPVALVEPTETAAVRYHKDPSVALALEALADPSIGTEEAFLLALSEFDRAGDPQVLDVLRGLQLKALDLNAEPGGLVGGAPLKSDGVDVVEVTYKGQKAILVPETNSGAEPFRKARASAALCALANCGFGMSFVLPISMPLTQWTQAGLPTPQGSKDSVEGLLVFETAGADVPLPAFQNLWRNWMRAPDAVLDAPLSSARDELEKQLGSELTNAVMREADDLTIRDFARQISAVVMFDFVSNNGSRFESKDGNDLKLRNKTLVSTRHLQAFQPRASTRIKGRFSWLIRLDQGVAESLANLEREKVSEVMFPSPQPAERAPLNVFWNQVEALKAKKDDAQSF